MTTAHTQVEILDRSVEKAHVWINDVAQELGSDDRHHAYRVLRAFLHALRDQLSVEETAQLAAQLPIFIRGVFYENWSPGGAHQRLRDVESFLVRIEAEARLAGETEASFAAVAAHRVLSRHISGGEARSVLHVLPAHLRELLDPGTDEPARAD